MLCDRISPHRYQLLLTDSGHEQASCERCEAGYKMTELDPNGYCPRCGDDLVDELLAHLEECDHVETDDPAVVEDLA